MYATEVWTVKIKDPRGIAIASRVVSKLVMFLAFARIPHNRLHVLPYLFERFPIAAFTHTAKTLISNEIRNSYEITHLAKINIFMVRISHFNAQEETTIFNS